MKSIQALLVVATFGLLLAGCASTAHIEKDEAVNFTNYKTYAWAENDDSGRIAKNSLQETSVRQAVNAELAKANWRESKKNPDIILKHDVLIEKTVKDNSSPVYSQPFTRRYFNPYSRRIGYIYYPSQFMGYDNGSYATREGTLTISMIDAKTDKVVWQGWATDEVSSKNLTKKEIQGSVKSIFRKFDVAKN
jgi:hypothetical protein